MLNANARKWVEALRSGEYKQAKGILSTPNGAHCCLGVACVLYQKEVGDLVVIPKVSIEGDLCINYDNESGVLPNKVEKWLGLKSHTGAFYTEGSLYVSLSERNDRGANFEQIADMIESEPIGLFKEP